MAHFKKKFNDDRIKFVGYIPSIDELNTLRWYSNLYFHGHSVGGTNPSLLEAMASNALICAHENESLIKQFWNRMLYFSKCTTSL